MDNRVASRPEAVPSERPVMHLCIVVRRLAPDDVYCALMNRNEQLHFAMVIFEEHAGTSGLRHSKPDIWITQPCFVANKKQLGDTQRTFHSIAYMNRYISYNEILLPLNKFISNLGMANIYENA